MLAPRRHDAMNGFKTSKEGQMVQFDVTEGPKGKQASNIQAL